LQSSRERLASLGIQIPGCIPDHDNHPQAPLAQAHADPVLVPGPTDHCKQQSLDAAVEARPQAAAADEAMPQVMPQAAAAGEVMPQVMPQATAAGEVMPQAAAADEAMPQAVSQMPAVHSHSTLPDAESSPGLGQPGVVEGGASGPDLAVKPVYDQPMAETQDDKSAVIPLREDAHSIPAGLSESPTSPAGTAAIPKQPQARAAPSSLIHGPAGAAINSPDASGPAGAAPSSPALPELSSFSTSPRAQPPSPTPATNVLGPLLGSYASATPTPEPELPTTDVLQKPQTTAPAPASDFSEQANEHSERDADAHPLVTPQAAPSAAPSSMPVPDQAPVKPSDAAAPSTRAPTPGEEDEAAEPQSPKAPLLGLSGKSPLPPLVLSPTRLPRPARTPEPVPSNPLPLTNLSDAAVPAPTIAANVFELQPSGQSGGQTSGQHSGQPSGQPRGQSSGQPSGQSGGQPSGAVQQTGGQAELQLAVPGSVAVSIPAGTSASEAVGEAAGAAPAEHVEADTGECGGLGCAFCAAQNMYLQHVMFPQLCQHCVRQHSSTQCNMAQHQHGTKPFHFQPLFMWAACISSVCSNGNCLDSMCSKLDISHIACELHAYHQLAQMATALKVCAQILAFHLLQTPHAACRLHSADS